jgi:hypothetical protein
VKSPGGAAHGGQVGGQAYVSAAILGPRG